METLFALMKVHSPHHTNCLKRLQRQRSMTYFLINSDNNKVKGLTGSVINISSSDGALNIKPFIYFVFCFLIYCLLDSNVCRLNSKIVHCFY